MEKARKKRGGSSLGADIVRRFMRNRTAMFALAFLILVILIAIFADVIISYDVAISQSIKNKWQSPSREHIFGTDAFGRDVFARIIHGSRYSLAMGVGVTIAELIVACILGSVAAYYGGLVDSIIMRLIDILISIPSILFSICIVAVLGSNALNLCIALTIGGIPSFTRIVRSCILNVKGADYIEAARSAGAGDVHIILKHILPNALGPVIVQATMNVSGTIIAAASLSFIGLGVQAPAPEWGVMLSEAKDMMRQYPYLAIIPGIAIVTTALGFNLMGDGMRDALDPKLKD